jgi:hypothetical protein
LNVNEDDTNLYDSRTGSFCYDGNTPTGNLDNAAGGAGWTLSPGTFHAAG